MVFCFSGVAIHFKIEPVDVASLIIVTEIKCGTAVFQNLVGECGAVILICIGPKVYPDKGNCIRRIVEIIHFYITIQGIVCVIECNIYFNIYLLLPVRELAVGRYRPAVEE